VPGPTTVASDSWDYAEEAQFEEVWDAPSSQWIASITRLSEPINSRIVGHTEVIQMGIMRISDGHLVSNPTVTASAFDELITSGKWERLSEAPSPDPHGALA
jgi:hypothetical protein